MYVKNVSCVIAFLLTAKVRSVMGVGGRREILSRRKDAKLCSGEEKKTEEKKSCKFYFNPKALHRNNRKSKRQLFCCLNDILVVFIPMEFMFIIFIYLLLRLHTRKNFTEGRKSHRVMAHRFLLSHGCFTGECWFAPSSFSFCNNVKSFFKRLMPPTPEPPTFPFSLLRGFIYSFFTTEKIKDCYCLLRSSRLTPYARYLQFYA